MNVGPTVRKAGGQQITDFSKPRPFPSFEAAVEEAVRFNPLRPRAHLEYSLVHSLRREQDGSWVWKHRFPEDRIMPREVEQDGAVDRPEMWGDVAQIACPTLVMRGGESRVFFEEDADKLVKALAKGSRNHHPRRGPHGARGQAKGVRRGARRIPCRRALTRRLPHNRGPAHGARASCGV